MIETSQDCPTLHEPAPVVLQVLERAIDAFDALAPGECLTLSLDRSPDDLLASFRSERTGEFDWTPICAGPAIWRIEVSRRPAPRGDLREVNEALSWDHDRLDELEAEAFAARARGDFESARTLYAAFAFGLRRHIRFEEELLFPVFEANTGMSSASGPTAVMRSEHREILDWLSQIEAGMGDANLNLDLPRQGFHAVLGDHNAKEEHIVYPGTDRTLSPSDRDELVARIQAL